jgi:tyrosyl-tRNA synthetase
MVPSILLSSITVAMKSAEEQLAILTRGTDKVLSSGELKEKLESGRPLRVKLGVDPTTPDLHFGHTVPLEKLRQFQELGHQVIFIIGNFTAMVGDPTGRSITRPPLTHEEVMANAKTYTEQAFKILDKTKTEIVYNGDWFQKMSFEEVMRLNSRVTMQQMLQREDFKNRIDKGVEVRLHEIQYPIMQGWDSVEIRSDVELGGTDQLFNILVGRALQKDMGMEQQVVMLMPILTGTDGVKKMSKSYGNYIGVTDEPGEMFGKVMSLSDETMANYYQLLLGGEIPEALHPMEAKKNLAAQLITRYHGEAAAIAARENWDTRFSKGDHASAELPGYVPSGKRKDILGIVAEAYGLLAVRRSNSDIRRLIQAGSIQLNGKKITDPKFEPGLNPGDILKLDKKNVVRIS